MKVNLKDTFDGVKIVIFSCLFILLFLGGTYVYVNELDATLHDRFKNTLLQRSLQLASDVNGRMVNTLIRLQGLADQPVLRSKYITTKNKLEFISQQVKKYGFENIFIADANGIAYDTLGNIINIKQRNYFHNAFMGIPTYSSILTNSVYSKPFIMRAVPIHNIDNDDSVLGVLIAKEKVSLLYDSVRSSLQFDQGEKLIFMDDKGILIEDDINIQKNFLEVLASENNSSPEKIYKTLQENRESYTEFVINDILTDVFMAPVGTTGWYIIASIPKYARSETIEKVLLLTISMVIAIFCVCIACVWYFFFLRREYAYENGIAQAALETKGIYYIVFDAQGIMKYCNHPLRKRMNWDNHTSTRYLNTFMKLTDKDDLNNLLAQNGSFQMPLCTRDGEWIYVQWHMLTRHKIDEWRILGTDFSIQHHKAAMEYAQSRVKDLQKIINNVPTPTFVRDIAGRIIIANSALKQFLRIEHTTEVLEAVLNVITPEELTTLRTAFQEILQYAESRTFTFDVQLDDEKICTVQVTQNPILDEEGKVIHVVGTLLDMTDTLQLQSYLEDEAQRLRDILDESPAGVFFTEKGFIHYCNHKAHEITGLSVEDSAYEVSSQIEGDISIIRNAVLTQQTVRDVPFSIHTPDGTLRHLLLTVTYTKHGNKNLHVIWAMDVTAIHQVQKELIHSRDIAESATQAKSDFLASMSHEIRTPMNAILGFLHLFDRNNLTTKQIDYLEKITVSATGLLRIINDILDFSKMEANKFQIEYLPFNLPSAINAVYSMMHFIAKDKGIELNVNINGDIPQVVIGDRERLNQILLNLVSNGIKFTSHGSVSITLHVEKWLPAQRVILSFSVRDTGIGISNEDAARLFQPFTQADASVSRRYGGTGLGLVISECLVGLMGGTINIQSTLGVGTTFTIDLPMYIVTDTEIYEKKQIITNKLTLEHTEGKRILIVEDNFINQEVIAAILEEYKFIIDFAENGKEAIEKVKEHTYTLIFMDIQMPVMDGLEASRCIRNMAKSLPYLATVPILAMTANVMNEDKQRCSDAGMNDHLAKPIDHNALADILYYWLQKVQ